MACCGGNQIAADSLVAVAEGSPVAGVDSWTVAADMAVLAAGTPVVLVVVAQDILAVVVVQDNRAVVVGQGIRAAAAAVVLGIQAAGIPVAAVVQGNPIVLAVVDAEGQGNLIDAAVEGTQTVAAEKDSLLSAPGFELSFDQGSCLHSVMNNFLRVVTWASVEG